MRTFNSSKGFVLCFVVALVTGISASSCANGVDDGAPINDITTDTPLATVPSGGGGSPSPNVSTSIAPQEQSATYTAQDVENVIGAIRAGESARAELAHERASSSIVQGYGARLAQDGSSTAASTDPLAASIARQDTASIAALLHLEGSEFDTEYMSNEVSLSARTVALVDHSLAPSVMTDPSSQDNVRNDVNSLRASAMARLLDALDSQAALRGRVDVRSPNRLF